MIIFNMYESLMYPNNMQYMNFIQIVYLKEKSFSYKKLIVMIQN